VRLVVSDVVVAAADDEREITGQPTFGLGRAIEPQPCVSALHGVE